MSEEHLESYKPIVSLLYDYNKENGRYPCFTELLEKAEKEDPSVTRSTVSIDVDKAFDVGLVEYGEPTWFKDEDRGAHIMLVELTPEGKFLYETRFKDN